MVKKYVEINFGEGDVMLKSCGIENYPDAVAVLLKNGVPRPIGMVEGDDPAFNWGPDEADAVFVFKDVKSIRNIATYLGSVADKKEMDNGEEKESSDDQT